MADHKIFPFKTQSDHLTAFWQLTVMSACLFLNILEARITSRRSNKNDKYLSYYVTIMQTFNIDKIHSHNLDWSHSHRTTNLTNTGTKMATSHQSHSTTLEKLRRCFKTPKSPYPFYVRYVFRYRTSLHCGIIRPHIGRHWKPQEEKIFGVSSTKHKIFLPTPTGTHVDWSPLTSWVTSNEWVPTGDQ